MGKAIATASKTKEIIEKWNLHARKGYGQNFLIDPSAAAKIAESVSGPGAVIEIGPGIGALTEQLAMRCDVVRAYEIDGDFLPVLADTLQAYDNVQIVHQDFLKVDIDADAEELQKDYGALRAAGNLPYYITTPVLFRLFEAKTPFSVITAMMQREVADRFAAGPNDPDYGALSVESQYLYETRKLVNVPRSSFYPAPNVDSAVIVFTRRDKEDPDIDRNAFFDFVKACFKQRRKTLYNNLKEYCGSGEKAMSVLETAGIGAGQRAQELDVDDFLRLFRSTL